MWLFATDRGAIILNPSKYIYIEYLLLVLLMMHDW